jgi:hypothetical protein
MRNGLVRIGESKMEGVGRGRVGVRFGWRWLAVLAMCVNLHRRVGG